MSEFFGHFMTIRIDLVTQGGQIDDEVSRNPRQKGLGLTDCVLRSTQQCLGLNSHISADSRVPISAIATVDR